VKLSTRGRYGVRILLELALQGDRIIPIKVIAQNQGIPQLYLEHLVAPLIAGGLIKSSRGTKGGVRLVKPPQEIKLSQIINLLEGSVTPVDCVDEPAVCPRSNICAARDVWLEMKKAIDDILESKTLQNLVEAQKAKTLHATTTTYEI